MLPSALDEKLAKMVELQAQMQTQTQKLIEAQQIQFDRMQQLAGRENRGEPSPDQQAPTVSVKLPKLEMLPFAGDILTWKSFWDLFESTIHKNTKLSAVEKFTYLKSELRGEALKTIGGISLSNANYEVAVKLLHDRYGDSQAIINAHYISLMDLPVSPNNIGKLRLLNDDLEKHLRSLEAHGQNIDQNIFISMITSKLPREVLIQLEMQKGHAESWTVTRLRELFKNYVMARESAERQSSQAFTNPKVKDNINMNFSHSSPSSRFTKLPFRSSAEALVAGGRETTSSRPQTGCSFCGQPHWSDECTIYPTMEARKERIKGNCFICLKKNHKFKDCRYDKPCFHCHQRKNHHRSLCPKKFSNRRNESSHLTSEFPTQFTCTSEQSMLASGETVLMQTAITQVRKPGIHSSNQTRILLDSGSQRTYITEDLAKKLKLQIGKDHEEVSIVTFGSEKPQTIKTPTTTLELQLRDGTFLKIRANVVPKITGTIHRMPVSLGSCYNWNFLWKDIPLADILPTDIETSTLELLIGNDYYLDLILPEKVELTPGLYLLGSKLGWILAGRTNFSPDRIPEPSLLILNFGQQVKTETCVFAAPDASLQLKPNLEEFWNLETIGIRDSVHETGDDNALTTFNQSVKCEDGRYYVTWPWKDENPDLPENYGLAQGRFKSLMQRLGKNPDLLQKYSSIIEEHKGIIEKVTETTAEGPRKHYIPHHAVITPTKVTTKVRVVYDASAKFKKSNKSLNECLHRGPIMLHDLCGLLLRFRTFQIALVADIEKAFLQVGLQSPDRDVTRFLWLKNPQTPQVDDNTQVYRFCRVPFGVISSPFLLGATVAYHMAKVGTPTSVKIGQNIYVDNVVTGCNTLEDACNFYDESKEIFHGASMNLREWATNSTDLADYIPEKDQDKRSELTVLGIPWLVRQDVLRVSVPEIVNQTLVLTKREVLKIIASLFDPLGFFSPVSLTAKLFLQELWTEKFDWDAVLPEEKHEKWSQISHNLQGISEVQIPRFVGLNSTLQPIRYQLLCFCDASTRAYATAVYLQVSTDACVKNNLVFSKTRLAPTKKVTVPRLELLAVLIGVRALTFVQKELNLPISHKVIWTDSQCVLSWIKTKNPLTLFVENRLREIRSHDNIQFRYISTTENPADIATRGGTVESLQFNSWWHGPEWLGRPVELWPTWNTPPITQEVLEHSASEKKKQVLYEAKLAANQGPVLADTPFGLTAENFSSLTKLLRVTAWLLRFVGKLKRQNGHKGPLTSQELAKAKLLWVQNVQQRNFKDVIEAIQRSKRNNLQQQLGLQLDAEELLRCHGRLTNAELSAGAISPILLPKLDPYTTLVIEKYHKSILHSGVSQTLAQTRQEYWIPQGRSVVKKVLRNCTICRRHEGGPYKMPVMPPLPKQRVTQCAPFTYTGLDYLGPLYVKDATEVTKVWVCLFTCMAVRAIHLELVRDMSTPPFLLCLRRFVARHGAPIQILSDNAPQFKLAKTVLDNMWKQVVLAPEVKNYVAEQGVRWQFITELSPWMGGFYERLVGLVKRCLRKAIGRTLLTVDQLQTFLHEVQAVVNSRPLVYVDDDINSNTTITPSDFLTLNPKTAFPEVAIDLTDPDYQPTFSSADKVLQMWRKGQRHLEAFWNSWRNEYLTSLRERTQSHLKGPRSQSIFEPKAGDIVLVKDDLPRAAWRLGKIQSVIAGRDGNVRSATILLPSQKKINRPVCLLYPIECPNIPTDDTYLLKQKRPETVTTRPPARSAAVEARKLISQQLN